MLTITFEVPERALPALRLSPTEFVKEMRVAAALLWYPHGELSQSKATGRAAKVREAAGQTAGDEAVAGAPQHDDMTLLVLRALA